MPHDNYFETATVSFREAIEALGPSAQYQNPAMLKMIHGLIRIAQGLEQQNRELETQIEAIASRLPLVR